MSSYYDGHAEREWPESEDGEEMVPETESSRELMNCVIGSDGQVLCSNCGAVMWLVDESFYECANGHWIGVGGIVRPSANKTRIADTDNPMEAPSIMARRIVSAWIDPKPYKLQPSHERELQDAVAIGLERVAYRCAEIANEVMNEESADRIGDAIRREFGLSTPKSDSTASTTHENPKSDKLISCQTDSD